MPHLVASPAPAPPASAAAVRRTPLYLEGRGQPLFACLHRPEGGHSGHAVLICPPTGHEQVHSHRALRHLADACAGVGFPTLRLDYLGTGDSAGSDEDAGLCAARIANVADARAWLRRELNCERITLIGLRLGALFAALSAAEEPVDGLLLWAPVVKGRSFVREMKALSLTAGGPAAASDDLEAAGFVLTAETARDLGGLDLTKAVPRCRRALVLDRDDAPAEARLAEHLKASGVEVEQAAVPGYADMMTEPHYTKVPHEAITRAVAWLGRAEKAEKAPERAWPDEAVLPGTDVRERAISVGPRGELFGVVSEPLGPCRTELPFVVLLNAGSAYHVGPNRLNVTLARELSGRGFRCLRLDLGGLGDSPSPDPARENHTYPPTMFTDIDLTLKHLRDSLGGERVVLMGLCSGAYAAFQSAAQLPSPVLVESVAINPLTFYWKEGMSLEASPAHRLMRSRAVLSALLRPDKWWKLLTGRTRLGIGGAVRALLGGWRLGGGAHGGGTDLLHGHPQEEDLPADLDRIVAAGRHLTFFFARSDPGHELLKLAAGPKVEALCRAGKVGVHFIEDADHTFSRRAARAAFVRAVAEHLCGRYPPLAR